MRLYESILVRKPGWASSLSLSRAKNRELAYGLSIVLLVGFISIALTLQGWRSRAPAFDLLTYIYSIRNFLDSGALPIHGDTGSYGSYKPPGTAWLMLPSTIFFSDPRLSEYAGTGLLHFSTLLGLFLLARKYFGANCAHLAVLMYGLSEHGLFLAGSLWPNGRPDFFVWIVFLTGLWVIRKDARFLAAAFATWAIGMYVDMGIMPAFLIFPTTWIYFRPPIRLKPLLLTGSLTLVIWLPYLLFETSRGFADIRSQLLQQNILPEHYQETWCDQSLTLQSLVDSSGLQQSSLVGGFNSPNVNPGLFSSILRLALRLKENVLSNFKSVGPLPGASYLLLILTLSSMLFFSVSGIFRKKNGSLQRLYSKKSLIIWIAVSLMLCIALLYEWAFPSLSGVHFREVFIDLIPIQLQKIFLLCVIAWLTIPWVASTTNHILIRSGIDIQNAEQAEKRRFLVLSLLIPWSLLVLFAEPGKPERSMWLWPIQVLFLAAFFTNLLSRLQIPKIVIRVGQLIVILIVAGNAFLLSRIEAWVQTGWAGPDAEEVQVVDFVAQQIKAEGKDHAAIGYQTFIYPFMAKYNVTNPIYKVGAEYDLFFRYRHGIANTNRCAEGVSEGDEYRIVQMKPKSPDWAPRNYFLMHSSENYYLVGEVGPYQVLKDHLPQSHEE